VKGDMIMVEIKLSPHPPSPYLYLSDYCPLAWSDSDLAHVFHWLGAIATVRYYTAGANLWLGAIATVRMYYMRRKVFFRIRVGNRVWIWVGRVRVRG